MNFKIIERLRIEFGNGFESKSTDVPPIIFNSVSENPLYRYLIRVTKPFLHKEQLDYDRLAQNICND